MSLTERDRKEYEEPSHKSYFSPEEQTNDILLWLGTNGRSTMLDFCRDSAGINKISILLLI